jgi:type II secretory pathway component GspD/PulD (secretin)
VKKGGTVRLKIEGYSPVFLFLSMLILSCPSADAIAAQEPVAVAAAPVLSQDGLVINPENKKISIDYKDANLVSVLKALSYSFDLNLVMTKDVQGKISANLKDITIDEALNAILGVNGYRFVRKDNIIYVIKANDIETQAQAFHLSFLTALDAKQILSKTISKRGDIQINDATNSMVVVDLPEYIEKVKQVLAEIDKAPIQVLIEAKVVDMQAKAFENLGTTINAAFDPKGEAAGGIFGGTSSVNENLTVVTSMAGPSSDVPGNQLRLIPTFKSLSLDVKIDALIQKNRAHVLASPSIATLNGKEAKIIIGERFPYLETTTTPTGNTQTTRFIDVGTSLKVTPMVSPDGWITMKVHPEVSSVSASLAAGPRITTREADSTIRVRDNETIIIGGLINKKDDRTKGGVPFLRSIPVVGWIFSKRSSDLEETELTVFITPHIIRASSIGKDLKSDADYTKGDIYTQDSLLAYAANLEKDNKPEEADLFRFSEMVQTYALLYKQFPESPKADLCLYKMGEIYSRVFKKNDAAVGALNELIEKFPNSVYAHDAQMILDNIKNSEANKKDQAFNRGKE